eukprot:2725904-Rhodomonas_salina.1
MAEGQAESDDGEEQDQGSSPPLEEWQLLDNWVRGQLLSTYALAPICLRPSYAMSVTCYAMSGT